MRGLVTQLFLAFSSRFRSTTCCCYFQLTSTQALGSDLEELGDQQAEVIGVAAGDRVVAPPADLTDQLSQTAALKLQVETSRNIQSVKRVQRKRILILSVCYECKTFPLIFSKHTDHHVSAR